ncbi:LuxR C-terminal-related transcriptional regulator [Paenibacillus sp. J2TS4]|uniref:LuxR C-terminal-related transcriptional regulator n=1 Tax=Paenibacillus sp. J2TS4 TaxID=2807194 RepID=UPI001B28D3EF|nr:LuxR C-terminal-related transcriptional regulator [Paenibacillus sp. J2TS4]GIP35070.1 hypothetical protein J2TS4_42800 [Paenibacillus sp. J2TS4]
MEDISQLIKDYHWMMNSIKLYSSMPSAAGEGRAAQFNRGAAPRKTQEVQHDPIHQETIRRDRRYKKIAQYEEKVHFIQERMTAIDDDREMEVLHWIIEGKSYRWIAAHMGLSHSHVARIKDSAVEKMRTYIPKVTKGTNFHPPKSL